MFMNSYRGASAVSRLQRFFVESEGQGGQAMLEFALVLPVVLLIITGVLFTHNVLSATTMTIA